MLRFSFYISLVFILSACQQNFLVDNSRKDEFVLASVQEVNFYFSDIPKIQYANKSFADSSAIVEKIIEKWINEEIFSLKAKEKISNLDEITFEAENYKRALIIASYEKELMNNFDLELTEEEIVDYYKQHASYFVFEKVHYDINYILLPRTTKNLAKIKKAISEGSENHWVDNYCANEPEKCVLTTSTLKKYIFLKDNFKLSDSKLQVSENYNYQYISNSLVMIYKINKKYNIRDLAPMEMVKKELTKLAMHNKKQIYLKEIKEKTIQKAKNDKIFEKHIN